MINELLVPTMAEITTIADIWLQGNLDAHHFIAADYWQENLINVREQLPQARLFVAREAATEPIIGFLGLIETEIAGLFINSEHRHQGWGQRLVTEVKAEVPQLTLYAYEANASAINFYLRQNFVVCKHQIDQATGFPELSMTWQRELSA
ncbi:GNAT family N-acetyltransferase [Lapidilactobacillus luobeiensis]|uniref:GNAT family N-acetyltransferase n=1 Tax=Lapidilactobacillus luobeiensis TaxID=2950371 RepID=UPI0021C4A54C|nr:GNAT family N-acetyltransferase [Lapidilactobacillus luobeiensis]